MVVDAEHGFFLLLSLRVLKKYIEHFLCLTLLGIAGKDGNAFRTLHQEMRGANFAAGSVICLLSWFIYDLHNSEITNIAIGETSWNVCWCIHWK